MAFQRSRALYLIGTMALSLLAGAGCESDSGPKHLTVDERAKMVPPANETWEKLGYRLQWRAFAGINPGAELQHFSVTPTTLIAQDTSSLLTVLEPSSGERRWSDQVHSPLLRAHGAVVYNDRVVASSESEAYFFDAATGDLVTKQEFADLVTTEGVVSGDVLVHGTRSNVMLGHHLRSGYRLWGVAMSAPMETPPVMLGGTNIVGAVSRAGDVSLVNAESGLTVGRTKMYGGSEGRLSAAEGALYVASRDQSLYAFSRDGGTMLWRIRTEAPLTESPVYHGGRVYCDLGIDGLSAIDAASGKILWSNKNVSGEVVCVDGSRLLVFKDGSAAVLDAKDGGVIETARLEGITRIVPEKLDGGPIYAASRPGVIAKLAVKP